MRKNADTVRVARLSFDPDGFVAHIATIWYEESHVAHLILAAFGERLLNSPRCCRPPIIAYISNHTALRSKVTQQRSDS
ncbi:hypothetical protein BN77_p10031 [Rhizobium mesoamericanum STM3625]|uniref:Uncharacterized protein n=1 Tax=Rhizobium mesoamericanum STM3625 TaxID=1211777 RepID=K0Q202_9HYPH|nr:hypothetical protein BN77_p10031 [Rhizobium mesoamericanum STM3625]